MGDIITLPDGKKAEKMTLTDTKDQWSYVTLNDGTKLMVKQTVLEVYKLIKGDDISSGYSYDPLGNPIYSVKSMPTVALDFIPESVREKKQ